MHLPTWHNGVRVPMEDGEWVAVENNMRTCRWPFTKQDGMHELDLRPGPIEKWLAS